MGIIRGKIEAPRELRPRMNYVGDSPAYQADDGNWYDKKTGEKLQVNTLEEIMENDNRKPARQFDFDEELARANAGEYKVGHFAAGARWQFEKDSAEIEKLQKLISEPGEGNRYRLLMSENEKLREELERERMRLAACGVAALGYFDGCAEDYKSASLDDTLRLQSALEAERAKSAKLREALKAINQEELNSQRPGGGYSKSAQISFDALKESGDE